MNYLQFIIKKKNRNFNIFLTGDPKNTILQKKINCGSQSSLSYYRVINISKRYSKNIKQDKTKLIVGTSTTVKCPANLAWILYLHVPFFLLLE